MVTVSTDRFGIAAEALVEELEDTCVVEVLDVSAVVEGNELDDRLLEDKDELAVEVTEVGTGCVEEPEAVLGEDDDSEVVSVPLVVVVFPESCLDTR